MNDSSSSSSSSSYFCTSSSSLSSSIVLLSLGAIGIRETLVSLQFLNLGRTTWTGKHPVSRPLPNTNTE
jgi:hypothetical protein